MNEKEFKEYQRKLKKYANKVSKLSPEESIKFLQEAGMIKQVSWHLNINEM